MKQFKAWAVVSKKVKSNGRLIKDDILSLHPTREGARQEKADWGGKKGGVYIVKLSGDKEVR